MTQLSTRSASVEGLVLETNNQGEESLGGEAQGDLNIEKKVKRFVRQNG